jgi:hypothetical protein
MSTYSLADLEAQKAAGTLSGTAAFDRWIEVHGPRKVEYIFGKQDAGDDFDADSETIMTRLAGPRLVTVMWASCDGADTATDPVTATIDIDESSATYKTITMHDADDIDTTVGPGVLIAVWGF